MKEGVVLSDLKDAVFGTENDAPEKTAVQDPVQEEDTAFEPVQISTDDLENTAPLHIEITETYDAAVEAPAPPEPEPEPEPEPVVTPEELIRESMDAVERMKQDIAAENADLDRRFARNAEKAQPQQVHRRRPVYVIGVLSSAASLIFMGIMLTISLLTSPIGAYKAIKAAPVMLVFLGAELIFAVFRKKTLRIKIDLRSVIIITVLLAASSVLTMISANSSSGTGERVYAEQRIQNMLADKLHDTIAKDYIKSVDIETQLFGENAEMYRSPADLTDGDIINLTVHFLDAQMSIREFAKDCHDILVDLNDLSYNFGHIVFIAKDDINRYTLDVDWHYQAGYSTDRLAAQVRYFGDDISDEDIPDIVDDE